MQSSTERSIEFRLPRCSIITFLYVSYILTKLTYKTKIFAACNATLVVGSCPGGGGGVLRFGSDGGVPLKPPNLAVPIFKGHFGGKGYPLLGVFIQENDVFVYFSDEMGENI